MKEVKMIIRPEKLEVLEEILTKLQIGGMMVSNIMGYGNQYGYTKQYRGTKYTVHLVSKLMVSVVTTDAKVDPLVQEVCKKLSTGEVGDGKIFIYDVCDAIRIRTGESGEGAL